MRNLSIVLFAVTLLAGVTDANAQLQNAPTDPFGRIFSARILAPGAATARMREETEQKPSYFFTGLGRYGNDVWSLSPSLTFSDRVLTRPYRLTASYSYIRPDEGDSLDRAGATASLNFFGNKRFAGTVIGAYGRVFDRFSSAAAIVAVEQTLPHRFAVAYNIGWAWLDIDDGPSIDDFVPAVGVSHTFADDRWALSADYTFDNDVDGESSWSVALDHALNDTSSLNLGFERHEVVSLKYTKRF